MMKINDKQTPNTVFVPLLIALALVVGIFIGSRFASKKTIDLDRKINNILGIVADEYVENVDMDSLVELTIFITYTSWHSSTPTLPTFLLKIMKRQMKS